MKTIMSVRLARAGLVLLGAGAMLPAMSQDAPREATSALEEIIVTAQRREESAQDVPISLTALDANQIEKSYARDIQDVENLVPNLIIDPTLGNGTASISIRGFQLNDVEKSFDPAVAVYLDGVYLANTTGALLQMYDAEAVEVLRGPQGTLFGRNTIGGLLNIRRAAPTGEFGGKFALNFGRFNQLDARAVLNFDALADGKFAHKLSVVRQDGGGYFNNVTRGVREGDTDFTGVTWSALIKPSDNFDALLTLDYFDDTSPTRPVTSLTATGEAFCPPGLTAGQLGCGRPKSDAVWHRSPTTSLDQAAFVETKAATLNMTWRLSDAHKLVSITGWRDVEDDALQEFDGVAAPVFWTQRPQTSTQFSQELRLESDWAGGRVKSVAGLYYFDNEYELNQQTFSPAFFGDPTLPMGIAFSARNFSQDVEAQAAFAQIDWNVTDNLILSLGGRYSKEDKAARGTEFLQINGVGLVPQISYGDDPSRPAYVGTFVDPGTGQTLAATGVADFSKFTPRVNLTWKWDAGKLAYVTYSKGYRSGGFNGRASGPSTLGPYQPEEVETIEIGAKTQWLDNRLRFNAAIFDTDYQDKQEDVVFPDPIAVTVTLVQNAASASIRGAEFELLGIPTDGLTLGLNIGLLDAKYDSWSVPGFAGGTVDKSGFELRRAPEFTASFNAQYEQPLGNGNFLVYGLNYSFKDDYYVIANTVQRPEAQDSGRVDAFGMLDASISYETESWSVSLWGKNLTEEDYFLHVLDVGTNYNAGANNAPVPVAGLWTFGTINPPRTYGVEFRFKF
ncbi:MAG: TonB-dependent receptor [Steroidobacteraceae bacterium]